MKPGEFRVVAVSAPEAGRPVAVPLYLSPCGSTSTPSRPPSPRDYVEGDREEWLVRNRPAAYFVRVRGDSTAEAFRSGDLLVVERSLDARRGDVVVARVGGETIVRRLVVEGRRFLAADSPEYSRLEIGSDQEAIIRSVAAYAARRVR